MERTRRTLVALLALAPVPRWVTAMTGEVAAVPEQRLVLSNFEGDQELLATGVRWRGFSDRVMGGVSDAAFSRSKVAGKGCIRLTGRVTRDSGGGFIQMALDLGTRGADFDASAYAGVEFLVYGNNEDYNVHIRTADCGWYDESYRATFRAEPRWQRLRLGWSDFKGNGVSAPLNAAHLQRIAWLGWMREFSADLALAEVALYRQA